MAKKDTASRTATLPRTYMFNRKFYGPGVVEVPADFPAVEELDERHTQSMARRGSEVIEVGAQSRRDTMGEDEETAE